MSRPIALRPSRSRKISLGFVPRRYLIKSKSIFRGVTQRRNECCSLRLIFVMAVNSETLGGFWVISPFAGVQFWTYYCVSPSPPVSITSCARRWCCRPLMSFASTQSVALGTAEEKPPRSWADPGCIKDRVRPGTVSINSARSSLICQNWPACRGGNFLCARARRVRRVRCHRHGQSVSKSVADNKAKPGYAFCP